MADDQHSEKRTPFELGGMSEKRIDSTHKANSETTVGLFWKIDESAESQLNFFSPSLPSEGRCGAAGDGDVNMTPVRSYSSVSDSSGRDSSNKVESTFR